MTEDLLMIAVVVMLVSPILAGGLSLVVHEYGHARGCRNHDHPDRAE
jgi:hypothetical protein